MRWRDLGLVLPVILAACAVREPKEPSSTALSFADTPVTPKSSPRAVYPERFTDAALEASAGNDACSAYADCIDEGTRAFGHDGMHASSATIRGWQKTPSQLSECTTAHELARAGGLCL